MNLFDDYNNDYQKIINDSLKEQKKRLSKREENDISYLDIALEKKGP